jgi:hypothetical protein
MMGDNDSSHDIVKVSVFFSFENVGELESSGFFKGRAV